MRKESYKYRRGPALGMAVLTGVLFIAGSLLVFVNRYGVGSSDRIGSGRLLHHRFLVSGEYLAERANRMQYVSHDPAQVDLLFRTAIMRSPGNYRILHSYAKYLIARNCCRTETEVALRETLRRAPTSVSMMLFAGSYFWQSGQKDAAKIYFIRSIQLQAKVRSRLLIWLRENGATAEDLAGFP